MVPEIHGKGRIIFRHLTLTEVRVSRIKFIPGGPPMNLEFVEEGKRILLDYPDHDLPYMTIVHDLDEGGTFWGYYWIIDGRHRLASYKDAHRDTVPALVGYGMRVLEK